MIVRPRVVELGAELGAAARSSSFLLRSKPRFRQRSRTQLAEAARRAPVAERRGMQAVGAEVLRARRGPGARRPRGRAPGRPPATHARGAVDAADAALDPRAGARAELEEVPALRRGRGHQAHRRGRRAAGGRRSPPGAARRRRRRAGSSRSTSLAPQTTVTRSGSSSIASGELLEHLGAGRALDREVAEGERRVVRRAAPAASRSGQASPGAQPVPAVKLSPSAT